MRSLFVAACLTGLLLGADFLPETAAEAATIESRLQSVEKKTAHYIVRKVEKTRNWRRVSGAPGEAAARAVEPMNCRYERSLWDLYTCQTDIVVGGTFPVITDAWVEITANYRSSVGIVRQYTIGSAKGIHLVQPPFCDERDTAPATVGVEQFHTKVLCKGIVNAQSGYKVRVVFTIMTEGEVPANSLILDGITVDAELIHEVLTEFD